MKSQWLSNMPVLRTTARNADSCAITFCEQSATSDKLSLDFTVSNDETLSRNSALKGERRASPLCCSSVKVSPWAARRGQWRPKAARQHASLSRVPPALHQLENRQPETPRQKSFGISYLTAFSSFYQVTSIRSVNLSLGGTASSSGLFAPCWIHSLSNRDLVVFGFSSAECRCRCRSPDSGSDETSS